MMLLVLLVLVLTMVLVRWFWRGVDWRYVVRVVADVLFLSCKPLAQHRLSLPRRNTFFRPAKTLRSSSISSCLTPHIALSPCTCRGVLCAVAKARRAFSLM